MKARASSYVWDRGKGDKQAVQISTLHALLASWPLAVNVKVRRGGGGTGPEVEGRPRAPLWQGRNEFGGDGSGWWRRGCGFPVQQSGYTTKKPCRNPSDVCDGGGMVNILCVGSFPPPGSAAYTGIWQGFFWKWSSIPLSSAYLPYLPTSRLSFLSRNLSLRCITFRVWTFSYMYILYIIKCLVAI
jgi:hypothetical protein